MSIERPGVWVAYHFDWSEFAIFAEEIQALRFAVQHSMQCERIPYGVGVREFVVTGAADRYNADKREGK